MKHRSMECIAIICSVKPQIKEGALNSQTNATKYSRIVKIIFVTRNNVHKGETNNPEYVPQNDCEVP